MYHQGGHPGAEGTRLKHTQHHYNIQEHATGPGFSTRAAREAMDVTRCISDSEIQVPFYFFYSTSCSRG